MTLIEATGLGKRFFRQWVFRGMDFEVQQGERVLLTGDNGSGKSTLMRILAGQLAPTEGQLSLVVDGKKIDPEFWYQYLSWSGPYMELYTDLSLAEAVHLHASFRKLIVPEADVLDLLQLQDHRNKLLKHFSSGMMHRVKVGLSILSQSKILLLDEATTNMDEANSKLVLDLMDHYIGDRLLIFASNRPEEFGRFARKIEMKNASVSR
ncbi:MAG: ATP-binding cassette domain-containing protein [Bacteroidia bacterium]